MIELYEKAGRAPEGVKDGFSWPAFFFGPLWALSKRMWGRAILLLIWLLLWSAISQAIGQVLRDQWWLLLLEPLPFFIYSFSNGYYGNGWIRDTLLGRGYVYAGYR